MSSVEENNQVEASRPEGQKESFAGREHDERSRNRYDSDRGGDDRKRGGGPPGGANRRYRRRSLDIRTINISYLEPETLERFISKTGKILPQRVTGATACIQRKIAREVKRARMISLLPFSKK